MKIWNYVYGADILISFPAKSILISRLLIADMQEAAKFRGGKCLSKEFIDQYSPLAWMCKRGHTWDAGYYLVKRGAWCSQCIRDEVKDEYLQEIKEIAKSKGGKCLSKEYINSYTHLEFECAQGHRWLAKANNIKTGWWCAKCSGNAKRTIEEYQEVAIGKGGLCLSKTYVNSNTKLKWQCAKGHQWFAIPYTVEHSSWCPYCAWSTAKNRHYNFTPVFKYNISHMQIVARDRGGRCLSKKYINSSSHLLWECKNGHTWEATPSKILFGQWCRICGNRENGKNKRVAYSIYQKLAKKNGGKLITPERDYKNGISPMKWKCGKGHVFITKPAYIKNSQSWCPVCAGKNKYTIDDMHAYADKHDGKCLSQKYVDSKTPLKWKCTKGHVWESIPSSIIQGKWCRQCYFERGKNLPKKKKRERRKKIS